MTDEELRCKTTGNLCGTDTWAEGYECPCGPCQKYLDEYASECAVVRWFWNNWRDRWDI